MAGNTSATEHLNVDNLDALRDLARRHPSVPLYVFGSCLRDVSTAMDLDVLAKYSSEADLENFREDLLAQPFSALVDVVSMSAAELHESGFLERSRAVSLDHFDDLIS